MCQIKNSLDPYERIKLLHEFGSSGTGNGQFDYPAAVCTFLDKIIVCDCNNHRIQIFEKSGQFISTFGSSGSPIGQFWCPSGICTVGENLWISDRYNHRIQIFNSLFHPVCCIPFGKHIPLQICCNIKKEIQVTSYEMVTTLSQDGHEIKKFCSKGKRNNQFDGPEGICYNSRDEILVSDSWNNRIQIFNKDGVFLRTLGSKGIGSDQFQYQRGICTDWEDNIYVADYGNNRVSIFNPSGIFIRQIKVHKPTSLCFMEGWLVVTTTKDFVKIFSNK